MHHHHKPTGKTDSNCKLECSKRGNCTHIVYNMASDKAGQCSLYSGATVATTTKAGSTWCNKSGVFVQATPSYARPVQKGAGLYHTVLFSLPATPCFAFCSCN